MHSKYHSATGHRNQETVLDKGTWG